MDITETQLVYKSYNTTELKLHLFTSRDASYRHNNRAAILFFHGGRFVQGHPAQFFPHCRYLASRGMVAASAEYRLLGKNAMSVNDCLSDSRAAIRWLRSHASDFTIDPTMIIVAGGSAGANLAANAAMMDKFGELDEESVINARPNALILFSPAVIRPISAYDLIDEQLYTSLVPKPNVPPMLLLHGVQDEFFSLDRMLEFCEQMRLVGNQCKLRFFAGERHGFFNYGREDNRPFYETLLATDNFLCELGILKGSATLVHEMLVSLRNELDWQA